MTPFSEISSPASHLISTNFLGSQVTLTFIHLSINFYVNVLTFDLRTTTSVNNLYTVAITADPSRVWGGGETYYVKIPRPSSGSRGVFRHIWLDPETVCYLDYDSDRACSVGPNPTPGSVGA
jgi:hypothetical protein